MRYRLAFGSGKCSWRLIDLIRATYPWLEMKSWMIAWGCLLPFHFVSTRRAIVNSVPGDKLGQSSGLTMTSQLLGGTVGMATCSALYASTGHFSILYLVTAGVMGLVAIVGFIKMQEEFE